MDKEPARIIGLIGAAVAALVGLAVAFGAPITPDQSEAVLKAIGPVAALIYAVAEVTRRYVTPAKPNTHRAD